MGKNTVKNESVNLKTVTKGSSPKPAICWI